MVTSEIAAIIQIIRESPNGISRGEIQKKLKTLSFDVSNTTLYRRLSELVDQNKVQKKGRKSGTKYFLVAENGINEVIEDKIVGKSQLNKLGETEHDLSSFTVNIFSSESKDIVKYLENPPYTRKTVTYNIDLLDRYEPNQTFYLPETIRKELGERGKRIETVVAAGTYARQIFNRLLIDLSYNSSRLEGNTYSELDTQRLIEKSITAEGKVYEETVMIINHKEAIAFLVENANDIDLNPFTIRNLHNLLSQDLLKNINACGDVRSIEVNIMQSTYKPASGYLFLKENLELLLLKARKIQDPYEQSFFVLLHISHLQAFEDVNKRTARLACNIPFVKKNLCPLSFTRLPKKHYVSAILIFYELNNCRPMVDLFRWAYLKSCERYDTVRQSLGDVDEFRVRYRKQRKECMGEVIRQNIHGQKIEDFARDYCRQHKISQEDKFIAIVITELDALHSGAIVGTGVSESQFNEWKKSEK